ncbi:MAG: nucleoside hydrolase, partial [Ilumatobacteraceae bacterium]|nr:nucleoside hydrolase [Ilumatobacteraceae bacterium]
HNARVLRDLLAIDVEVHAGASRPLVAEPRHAGYVHGVSGLDGADLPEPVRPLDGTDAVRFIIDTCRSVDDVTLVPTGPLTNIALALRSAPDLSDRIAAISLMGGGTIGNRSAVAEFNIWADPEAAAIVFRSGIPLVMTGLDVTHRFLATPDRVDRVRSIDGRLATVLADLFEFFSGTYVARHTDLAGAAVHDPLAVLAVTHPELCPRTPRHVDVETSGALTRGMTVIDRRTLRELPDPTCDVVDDVDVEAAWDVVVGAIASFSR